MDRIGRVHFSVELHFFAVMPEVIRVVRVSQSLAVVAEELVEMFDRIAGRTGCSEAPFAEHARLVSRFLQQSRQRHDVSGHRSLTFRLHFAIASHNRVSGMQASHQTAAGWCADRAA